MIILKLVRRLSSIVKFYSATCTNNDSTASLSVSRLCEISQIHYSDVIMGTMASQITSLTIVYSTVYSGADQRKHQSSASLTFVMGIHRWPVNSPHKRPVTRKMFLFDDVIMGPGWVAQQRLLGDMPNCLDLDAVWPNIWLPANILLCFAGQKFKNVWLHIDSAYAGSAFICPEYRNYLNGVEVRCFVSP